MSRMPREGDSKGIRTAAARRDSTVLRGKIILKEREPTSMTLGDPARVSLQIAADLLTQKLIHCIIMWSTSWSTHMKYPFEVADFMSRIFVALLTFAAFGMV